MSVWQLNGNHEQNKLVERALDRCDFPFELLIPEIKRQQHRSHIPVFWRDLSRFQTDPAPSLSQDRAGRQGDHARAHGLKSGAHPIEREIDGRMRVLGLAYYSLRVELDVSLINNPELAMEVFLAEGAHMVDFAYMQNHHRVAVVDAVHVEDLPVGFHVRDGVPINLDAHTCSWFDIGTYAWWVGEAFMEGFIRAFAPTQSVSIQLKHPVDQNAAEQIRWALTQPDVFGTLGGKRYHKPNCVLIQTSWLAHKVKWATPEEAQRRERTPCRVCRPVKSSWDLKFK